MTPLGAFDPTEGADPAIDQWLTSRHVTWTYERAVGDWHHSDEVIDACARLVPPGLAYRRGENQRVWSNRHSPVPPHGRVSVDDSTSIAAGARETIRKSISGFIRSGLIERDGDRYHLIKPDRAA